ncbi:MAG: hypothetical protein H6Q72_4948 [Firmicutes bacterium]|nr:hypothetical protein [Bacillota bacterium]
MTEFTFQTKIYAAPQDIWEMYADFTKRRQWETDLEYIKLKGDFSTGTQGTMKLVDQPEMPYTITSVVPYKEYWDRTELPGTGMVICFGHEFTPNGNSTLVKVSVKLEKSTGEITEEDILFLAQVFSDTPQSILAIKKFVEK